MRVILYTGKGGVGKTSLAVATGLKMAQDGKSVMLMSTDQAHSLGDALETKLSGQSQRVFEAATGGGFVDALEIDVVAENEAAWRNIKGFIKDMLTSRAQGGIEAEELLVFPGLEELFALFKILDYAEAAAYDVLIVDCAPTGETLSLLKFPENFGDLFKKILPMKRKAARVAGPMVERVMKIPMPKDTVFDDIEILMEKMERLQALMQDHNRVSLRLVTTPEKIVVAETKRNFTWLHLYNYNVDAILINKVYPEAAMEGYFSKWAKLQREGLEDIHQSFHHIPKFTMMLAPHELRGPGALLDALTSPPLYGEVDPARVLVRGKIFEVSGLNMRIYLPFADKAEMDLTQQGGDLHIAIKNELRVFTLPDALKGKQVASAKLEEGILSIAFSA